MTLFEALTGGAFDRLNWQHSGEFDQNFSKKSNGPGFAPGGGGMGGFGIDWYIKERSLPDLKKCRSSLTPVYCTCILFILSILVSFQRLELHCITQDLLQTLVNKRG